MPAHRLRRRSGVLLSAAVIALLSGSVTAEAATSGHSGVAQSAHQAAPPVGTAPTASAAPHTSTAGSAAGGGTNTVTSDAAAAGSEGLAATGAHPNPFVATALGLGAVGSTVLTVRHLRRRPTRG